MTSDSTGAAEDGRAPTEELSCVRDGTSDRRGRPSTDASDRRGWSWRAEDKKRGR